MTDKETADYLAGKGEQAVKQQEEMLRRVQDAKQALGLAMATVRQEWIDWIEKSEVVKVIEPTLTLLKELQHGYGFTTHIVTELTRLTKLIAELEGKE